MDRNLAAIGQGLVGAGQPATPGQSSAAPRPRTLLDIFNATAVRCPAARALEAPDGHYTYRELAAEADRLAQRLRELGVGPGERVAVRVESGTAALYIAILGVLCAGAAYVPIEADEPDRRAESIIAQADVCAVVGDGLQISQLRPARGAEREVTTEDDAWVIFTSGSTGKPKGVAVSHRAAAAFVDAEAQLFSISPGDRVLAALSVSFDASCEEIWLAWRHGATLVPAPRILAKAGAELGRFIVERGITVVSTVPSLAALFDPADLAGVRLLILGGEACPPALAWELARDREVWNTYGPTEATVVTTAARIEPGKPVTIGWPLPGWEVAIVDGEGKPVTIGGVGELVIAGVGLGRYLDRELDAKAYAPLPALGLKRAYRTGDLVRETINGIEFVGRADDQVKIGGRRLELGEVEARFAEAPGVRAAACALRETKAKNKLLVAYLVGERLDLAKVRAFVQERLPAGLPFQLVELEDLPRSPAGKVNRRALPWPPPSQGEGEVGGELAWLAERWREQLGEVPLSPDSDFFALGGGSLAAAKLATALRKRFPGVAVADIYRHRTLESQWRRLCSLAQTKQQVAATTPRRPRLFAAGQVGALLSLLTATAPAWVLGALILNRIYPGNLGPQVWWVYLLVGWLLVGSMPGRVAIVALARRLLLAGVKDGRYPRHSLITLRIWLLERLADAFALEGLGGTPWAARYARLLGLPVGRRVWLGTVPSPASFVRIEEGATVEADVDLRGWWHEGGELVVGTVVIGREARVGTRALLMPGARIGEGAEVEPGSLVWGEVSAGRRFAGVPARDVGPAGEGWPTEPPPSAGRRWLWKACFALGVAGNGLLSLLALAPGLALVVLLRPRTTSPTTVVERALELSPAITAIFVLLYALLVAVVFRAACRLVRPGLHSAEGPVGFGLWLAETVMSHARETLFPLFSSIYTAPWLRLAGIEVGRRAEISTVVGATCLDRFADKSFCADDVVFVAARARAGWLEVAGSQVGPETFLGNGAILAGATELPKRTLVGVLTTPPRRPPAETSWFGSPALELPRPPLPGLRERTTDPSRRLVLARAAVEAVRIVLPALLSGVLGSAVFWGLDAVGVHVGVWAMFVAAPALLFAGGIVACLLTVLLKWTLIGRYRPGEHPLWSFFVWRDEIINSAQEVLAGTWLLEAAMGTPLLNVYLRLMGTKVGRDVWCETLTITEYEQAELGDGCALNRHSVVETHLFHDRVMRIGPVRIGAGATLGPSAASLPETVVGEGCSVGGRSVVMRGENLPAHTRWHGAPVFVREDPVG